MSDKSLEELDDLIDQERRNGSDGFPPIDTEEDLREYIDFILLIYFGFDEDRLEE